MSLERGCLGKLKGAAPDPVWPAVEQNEGPVIQEEMLSDLLYHSDTHKSMEPVGIHSRVLRKLVEVHTKTLSIISQQSQLTGEVPVEWR